MTPVFVVLISLVWVRLLFLSFSCRHDRHTETEQLVPAPRRRGDRSVSWSRSWTLHSDWRLIWWAGRPMSRESTWAGGRWRWSTRSSGQTTNQKAVGYTEGHDWPRGLSFAVLMSRYLRNQVDVEPASFLYQLGVADFLPGWLWLAGRSRGLWLIRFWLLPLFLSSLWLEEVCSYYCSKLANQELMWTSGEGCSSSPARLPQRPHLFLLLLNLKELIGLKPANQSSESRYRINIRQTCWFGLWWLFSSVFTCCSRLFFFCGVWRFLLGFLTETYWYLNQ